MEPRYPGAVEEIINLGEHWDSDYLQEHQQEIIDLAEQIQTRFKSSAAILAEAGSIYEQNYQQTAANCDQEALEKITSELSEEIFQARCPQVRRFFSTAFTNKGPVDLRDDLSRDYAVRYLLVGAPGSGGSQILEHLAQEACSHGHTAELYHNSWRPPQAELLLLPDLQVALMLDDGLQEPNRRAQDRLIDLDNSKQIKSLLQPILDKASAEIAKAKALHDELEAYYCHAMDFEQVDESQRRLFNKILNLAAQR